MFIRFGGQGQEKIHNRKGLARPALVSFEDFIIDIFYHLRLRMNNETTFVQFADPPESRI
jgi:hypothetical protein